MRSKRVFIVEDQLDAAQMLAMLIALLGHVTCFVTDPRRAIGEARHFRPDVILLDIGMPQIDGWTLAGQMRAVARLRKVRLYAVTAYGSREDRARSAHAGFDGHVVKPLSAPDLIYLLA